MACASSTRRLIWASAESLPTRVARNVKLPVVFTVPPVTESPIRFPTGIGSPVSIDSSTADAPSVTTPSTGTRSPGFTSTRSPGTTASTAISVSRPPRSTCAVFALRPASRRMASDARPLAPASSSRPSRMRAMIAATAS